MKKTTPTKDIFSNIQNTFVGKEIELNKLKHALIERKDRIVAISGNNSIGKTSLWKAMLLRLDENIIKNTKIIYTVLHHEKFPDIENNVTLVILEDLSLDHTISSKEKINQLIQKYPQKQFLLVGAYKDFLESFSPREHIHLESLHANESILFILEFLSERMPKNELTKITAFTQGNPFLLRLVAQYLNSNAYNSSEILEVINQGISYKSGFSDSELAVPTNSEKLIQLSTDIRLVNKTILERVRQNPEGMYKLTSREFEEMVAELMIKRGFEVKLTKKTRDGGKDLIIANHMDVGNFMYYVECKKYAPTNPVGVNLVRELVGAMSADRATAGIMITSSYFSPDAIKFSKIFQHQLGLVDFIQLKEWLKKYG